MANSPNIRRKPLRRDAKAQRANKYRFAKQTWSGRGAKGHFVAPGINDESMLSHRP